ncbi:MAG: preprotein translocase subunit SecY, partial [Bdellovibrionota bacterium]
VFICVAPSLLTGANTRFGGTSMLILVSVAMLVLLNVQAFLYSDRYESAYKSRGKYSGMNKRF